MIPLEFQSAYVFWWFMLGIFGICYGFIGLYVCLIMTPKYEPKKFLKEDYK